MMEQNTIAPILVTAGPTYEAIDSVRFIGNRSSGRMGVAIAEASCDRGYETILLLGPNCVEPPDHELLTVARFRSTTDLEGLLNDYWPGKANTLIMAAAVSDFRPKRNGGENPANAATIKLRRQEAGLTLELESTPDLVAMCCVRKRAGQRVIGFALESTDELVLRAEEKLRRKGLDAIVANPLDTMDSDEVRATLVCAHDKKFEPGPMSKTNFAKWMLRELNRI